MPEMRSTNPVFTRGGGFGRAASTGDVVTPSAEELASLYRQPGTLTIDDVIIHTVGLFAIVAATGAVGWALSTGDAGIGLAAGLGALALSFALAFGRVIRPALVILFAVLEGLFVGVISRAYESAYSGIVLQALLGTGLVFVTMLVAYRSGKLRATPRMTRIVVGSLMGVVALGLIDLVIRARQRQPPADHQRRFTAGHLVQRRGAGRREPAIRPRLRLHRPGDRGWRPAFGGVARVVRPARRIRLGLPRVAAFAVQVAQLGPVAGHRRGDGGPIPGRPLNPRRDRPAHDFG